ncbi:MAG: formylglycine-generating enzyme family protein, partial [Planctomycetes bacterium]|nr:formylglycine-generating enzyme family protein [Planctomycetota bacterium]
KMGSEESDMEKPVHEVTITKPFYLGKCEVTQEQWEAVMGSNPSRFKGRMNPVEQVSWNDCQGFLKKLNPKLTALTATLPTEAEWEYACRAGSTTKYCFGNEVKDLGGHAWHSGNSGKRTHPVSKKKPNAWGLYDMHGNVWEWCQDWFGKHRGDSSEKDPTGAKTGRSRVLRGGSWYYAATYCRSASRNGYAPSGRGSDYGFRVALRGGVD